MNDDKPHLFLISGVMAAGKSTVAQALAERFERSAHVRGDVYRRSIVSGREEMSAAPSPEALAQLRLRYELAVATADRYVEAGFTTVMQDTIVGPMLAEVVDMVRSPAISVCVLTPSVEEVERRENSRTKVGYGSLFLPADLDEILRNQTPRVGIWIDSSELTVDETVDVILREASGPDRDH